MIKLRRRLIILGRPALAAVERNAGATVAAIDETIRICRIDPQSVMVAVSRGEQIERLAAIGRTEESGVQGVDGVCFLWIGIDIREIPRALRQAAVAVDMLPVLSAIVRKEQAAVFRLDHRIDALGIGG